jgi:NO-binding membrane sensor protein with MHYT domain
VADLHHFAFGMVNPALAYLMSFLGSLLGLILTARARKSTGLQRARWLLLAGIAIGGTGIWLMHFMAMLGFDVPKSVVRYDAWMTIGSLLIAVTIVSLGLFAVGFGRPSFTKIVVGGLFTGAGVAAMHYTGMAAMRVGGVLTYDLTLVGISIAIAVVASTVALWFAVVISGGLATVAAALLMGVAVSSMHYTGMAAVRVRLQVQDVAVAGVDPFELLAPISILACVAMSTLAFATVGLTVQQENARDEALLARALETSGAATIRNSQAGSHAAHSAY